MRKIEDTERLSVPTKRHRMTPAHAAGDKDGAFGKCLSENVAVEKFAPAGFVQMKNTPILRARPNC